MRYITITPTATAVAAGLALSAYLLTARRPVRRSQPAQQLTDAHRAGYTLALTHVSRGLLIAAPEEP